MKILILGAGYAGLNAALRLANRRLGVSVTVVNAAPEFIERVRHHELGAGKAPRRRLITRMLRGTGVRFIAGYVTGIDLTMQRARLADGSELDFDRLVFALGSVADDGGVPGVREHAFLIGDEAGALRLRAALEVGAREVVVVGGGLTGVETAAEMAERGARVTLVTSGGIATFLSEGGKEYLRGALGRMGVRIRASKVWEVRTGAVALDRGELRCDACVWAGGFCAPPLARESGLEISERGRIVVDARLRSVSHPDVYAIGDAADPRFDAGAPIGTGCKYAMPMGVHAAENLARSIAGKVELPFRFGDSIFCISVGRRDGLTQLMTPDGQPRGIITGRPGAWIKERIVRYTVSSMHVERLFASFRWPQPRRLLPTSPSPSGTRPEGVRTSP